jgi:hypothetical protein
MNQQTPNQQPKFSPDRRVVVWNFVKRCIEKAGTDSRAADAQKLVGQQIRAATDEGGKE